MSTTTTIRLSYTQKSAFHNAYKTVLSRMQTVFGKPENPTTEEQANSALATAWNSIFAEELPCAIYERILVRCVRYTKDGVKLLGESAFRKFMLGDDIRKEMEVLFKLGAEPKAPKAKAPKKEKSILEVLSAMSAEDRAELLRQVAEAQAA